MYVCMYDPKSPISTQITQSKPKLTQVNPREPIQVGSGKVR